MTKSTITREQLEEWVAQFDEDGGCDATDMQLEALIRQSLAAMDSEPDCKERKLFCSTDTTRMRKTISVSAGTEDAPLYRRAAMLQAGTLTNEGTKQAWTGIPDIDNAINMLDRIDTLDSCDDDRIEAVKTVLRGLAGNSPMWVGVDWAKGCELGNSPVIPDGYVMVPKEMTDEIGEAIAMQANCCGGIALDIYDAMLAAAPQSPGSEPATVPGKWIPVSERMPEMGEKQRYVLAADFKNNYWPNIPNTQVGVYGDWFDDGNPTWDDGDGEDLHLKEVTHWMPLPAGPQEVR